MKKVLLLVAPILVLFFSFSKDETEQMYERLYDYRDKLDAYVEAVENEGDIEGTRRTRDEAGELLKAYTELLQSESESLWPPAPANWKCHLECVYREWRCRALLGGDELHCLTRYQDCSRSCLN